MKFSASIVAVIAATSAVSDVSAFGINNLAVRRSTFTSTARTMALDDLESKLLSDPAPTKTKKERAPKKQKKVKAPEPEPEPEPVVEATKSKYAPKKKEKRVKKANPNAYDLSGVDEVAKPKVTQTKKAPPAPKPKKEKPAPVKKEKSAPKPKKVKPAPVVKAPSPPKSTSVATKDPNAGLGVVVGGAPLLLAPLVALSATRGALSKTAARREAIQEAAAEKERQAKAKAAVDTDVDSGGIVGALVSLSNSICHLMVDGCDLDIARCIFILHKDINRYLFALLRSSDTSYHTILNNNTTGISWSRSSCCWFCRYSIHCRIKWRWYQPSCRISSQDLCSQGFRSQDWRRSSQGCCCTQVIHQGS